MCTCTGAYACRGSLFINKTFLNVLEGEGNQLWSNEMAFILNLTTRWVCCIIMSLMLRELFAYLKYFTRLWPRLMLNEPTYLTIKILDISFSTVFNTIYLIFKKINGFIVFHILLLFTIYSQRNEFLYRVFGTIFTIMIQLWILLFPKTWVSIVPYLFI